MDYAAFVEEVMHRARFGGPSSAERAIEATLHALAQPLSSHIVDEIARHLPREMAEAMRAAQGPGATTASDFYGRICERAELSMSQGLEQAQIVCAVLAKRLEPTVSGRLSRELPDEIAALLTEVEEVVPLRPISHRGLGSTLAEGKPGARHSLSEGRPGSNRPLSEAVPSKTQSHSVATEDPHEDSKISSAHGLTQEREHESLAEGHDPKQ